MPATREAIESLPEITEIPDSDEPIDIPVDIDADESEPPAPTDEGGEDNNDEPKSPESEGNDDDPPNPEDEDNDDALSEADAAAAYRNLVQSYTTNTKGFIEELIKQLSPEDRAALGVGAETEQKPAESAEGWDDEELTAPELFVKQHKAAIAELPQYREALQTFGAHIEEQNNAVRYLAIEQALRQVQMEAIFEALDLKLPEITDEPSAVLAYATKHNVSAVEAAKKIYGAKVKAAKEKAAKRSRPVPATLQNEANAALIKDLKPANGRRLTLVELAHAVKNRR